MTRSKHVSDEQMLENSRVALHNLETQSELAAAMAEFTYDAAKVAEGKQLWEQTRSVFDANKREDDETSAAKAFLNAKIMAIDTQYTSDRKKAKFIFRDDAVTLGKLGLTGTLPTAYISWVETMKALYFGVKADNNLLTSLAPMKITPESVDTAIATISEMETARADYLREAGESQEATKAKDKAMKQLDKWMRELFAVARIALSDKPQLLEALGLFVRS
jgi:hypothetical protein